MSDTWKRRSERWAARLLKARITSPGRHHTWIMLTLTLGTLLLAFVAAWKLDLSLNSSSWIPLAAALMVSLASPVLPALEYQIGLRLIGQDSSWSMALRVSVYGSLANALPLPGGVAVKLKAMTEQGAPIKRAVKVSVLAGLIWVSLSAFALGVAIPQLSISLVIVGGMLLFLTLGVSVVRRLPFAPTTHLFGVEFLFIVFAAIRFFFVMAAIGVSVEALEAVGLAASGPIASALGLVPGALGVFESLSAGIAVLIGVPAAAGFLAAVILRVLTLISVLLWTPLIRSQLDRHAV